MTRVYKIGVEALILAAPENRILTRSYGEAKAEVVEPAIWAEPVTISAPEDVRIDAEPRTATKTTDVIGR